MFHVNGLSVVHVKLVKYVVEVAFESNQVIVGVAPANTAPFNSNTVPPNVIGMLTVELESWTFFKNYAEFTMTKHKAKIVMTFIVSLF